MIDQNSDSIAHRFRAGRGEFLWLCGLILSFAYERPIWILSSYDRMNPRLYDVVSLLGFLAFFPRLRWRGHVPSFVKIWMLIVAVFCFCSFVWTIGFLPWEYGRLSMYFTLKYLQGLAVILLVCGIPLSSRRKLAIQRLTVAGGAFVSAYCIPQYLAGGYTLALTERVAIKNMSGSMVGPLGTNYVHLGMFLSLSCCFCLSLVSQARTRLGRFTYCALAVFIAWPLLFSGSRTALALGALCLGLMLLFQKKTCGSVAALLVISVVAVLVLGYAGKIADVIDASYSLQRLRGFSEGENSVTERMTGFTRFDLSQYRWNGDFVPLIGAGFYVAPVYTDSHPRYRVGYGIHNSFLFALEQGGLAAFYLYFLFLFFVIRSLWHARRTANGVDRRFATAVFVFMIALVPEMLGDLGLWLSTGTGNFNPYIILQMIIAARPSVNTSDASLMGEGSAMGGEELYEARDALGDPMNVEQE